MQGAGVKQTRSVCSPRARAAAAGRSRCVFAKQIRGFFAQSLSPMWMRRYRISAGHAPHQRRPRRKIHPRIPAQTGMRFPDDISSGNCIPESKLGMGYIFRMTPQVEAATRNRAVEWDMLSPWQPRRKAHPGIAPQNGTCFPPAAPSTPKPMRPPSQNWVEESQNAIAGGQYDCRR